MESTEWKLINGWRGIEQFMFYKRTCQLYPDCCHRLGIGITAALGKVTVSLGAGITAALGKVSVTGCWHHCCSGEGDSVNGGWHHCCSGECDSVTGDWHHCCSGEGDGVTGTVGTQPRYSRYSTLVQQVLIPGTADT